MMHYYYAKKRNYLLRTRKSCKPVTNLFNLIYYSVSITMRKF